MKPLVKRLFLLAGAATLALIAIAQVPSGILPAGMILGGASASSSGTAKFSMTGGTISGLVMTGCITNVTRSATGTFAVTVSGCPSNYVPLVTGGDSVSGIVVQVDPVASYGPTGFTGQGISLAGAAYDPGLVCVNIP